MATCSILYLFDEFNWGYKNYNKEQVISSVLGKCPHAIKLADFYGCLIFDIEKTSPTVFMKGVSFQALMVSDDIGQFYPKLI